MSFFKRIFIFVIKVEVFYLLIFNIALNVPLTQELINQIKPDKFSVNWDSAWTLYPFRVQATGVAANGQTRSQQWQFQSVEASAAISLLPLVFKSVNLSHIEAVDVTYFQRPRPRADKDHSAIRQYFPPITGRELEINPPQLTPLKAGKKGWNIELQDMRISGEHSIWLYQMQATLKGNASADLSVITRGGPLSLRNGEVDLGLESMVLNGTREVSREGHIQGTVELLPFIVRENKGLKSLAFLNLDVELTTQTESLAFLNLYLGAFEGMKLNGSGELQGRVVFEQGKLLPKSDLGVSAQSLKVNLLDYRIEGDGKIQIQGSETGENVDFAIAFNDLEVFYADQPAILTGTGLTFDGIGTNNVVPLGDERPEAVSLELSISLLQVPDLSAFQRFLPPKWSLKLHGGEGELLGRISMDHARFSSDITLRSEHADIGIKDYRIGSNLDMRLNIDSPSLKTGLLEISGTHIKINEAQVSSEEEQSAPWYASINIEKGKIQLDLEPAGGGESGARHFAQSLKEQDIGPLIAAADEELKITGKISDLRWLNVLLKTPHDFVINGNGEITSDIIIKSGWLDKGTRLNITPQEISVEVLDYIAAGGGNVDLKVIEGGEFPDLSLEASIKGGEFRRKLEEQAFIEDVDILLHAVARGVELGVQGENSELRLQIPSATIKDMSVYNSYLPENAPLQILAGEASLQADITLQRDDAIGYVQLDSNNLRARADEQEISAVLSAEIKLAGGSPQDMRFNISGTTFTLDAVKVIGEQASFREDDWAADIRFKKAHTVWKKPVQLDVEAELEMTDSIPIVSMMANQKGDYGWLEKALIIDDVMGDLQLQIANNQIVIPYAFATSDNIDVGAKAIISKETRNGMLFVRYKALKGLLKINDGERNFDVFNAKEKFDNYSTDEVIAEKGLSVPQ